MEASYVSIRHPNREKAESKATKAAVVLLLVVSAGIVGVVTVGGWSELQGATPFGVLIVLIYLLMAWYAARWSRGVLPTAGALAVLVGTLGAIAAPAWFNRDKTGFHNPALPPSFLGLLCLVLIPVSVLLIIFATRGFTQAWNVEVEERYGEERYGH
jgi:protein-S-isoprenylcysteine O-methyltransferase Ste14